MGRRSIAAWTLLAVLVAMAMAVSGCGKAPTRVASSEQSSAQPPLPTVDAPDAGLASNPVVAATATRVVKIKGVANSCGKSLEGTGFVVAPNRVMTNAHVVAGADTVSVDSSGTSYDAHAVSYDPDADISILDVPNLKLEPLTFATDPAKNGADALVLGYPDNGAFVAAPARIREVIKLTGPDIYHTKTLTREVYSIRGGVKQGVSGAPLIDPSGQVLGVVFGLASDDPDTGFVMTAREVAPQILAFGDVKPVATGPCVP